MQEEEKYSWSHRAWKCSSVILPNGEPSVLIQGDEREQITSQTKATCVTSEWIIFWRWMWQGRTRASRLLLLRPQFDWVRKNQIIWQHVIPCSLKPALSAQKVNPCGKRREILHEGKSRAKKHRNQQFMCSVWRSSHANGESNDPVEKRRSYTRVEPSIERRRFWRTSESNLRLLFIIIFPTLIYPNPNQCRVMLRLGLNWWI